MRQRLQVLWERWKIIGDTASKIILGRFLPVATLDQYFGIFPGEIKHHIAEDSR